MRFAIPDASDPDVLDASTPRIFTEPLYVASREFEIVSGPIVSSFCASASASSRAEFSVAARDDAPPVLPPADLCDAYTLGDRIPVSRWYFDDKSDKEQSYQHRTRDEITSFMEEIENQQTYYYGQTDTWLYSALQTFPIKDKRVLLMGSNVPWYESVCLVHGAAECVTLEYNELSYEHERLTTVTVEEYERDPGKYGKFDMVWSISSFEHDGLGRYGDPLNPSADLEAMAKAASYLRPDGLMVVSVPVGKDEVRWNEGRVYGRIRLPMLLSGWDLVGTEGFSDSDLDKVVRSHSHQPVFVVKRQAPEL